MQPEINAYPALYDLARQRYSCRAYSSKPLPRPVITAILDVARLAPSATNRQPWTFLVADTPELTAEICKAYTREWAPQVPAYIVVCGHHDQAWHRPLDGKDHTDIDVAIAAEHICLAAASLGVGSCWICAFNPDAVCESFNIPEGTEPVALIALGYPENGFSAPEKKRKNIDQIVKWGKF